MQTTNKIINNYTTNNNNNNRHNGLSFDGIGVEE